MGCDCDGKRDFGRKGDMRLERSGFTGWMDDGTPWLDIYAEKDVLWSQRVGGLDGIGHILFDPA